MGRQNRVKRQLKPLHLFICEDSKSSKYYMVGLGKDKGINIKAENAYGTSPLNVLRSAKEKLKQFYEDDFVKVYCLFDKDDCKDKEFEQIITDCHNSKLTAAISVPCYEYWLLLHLKNTRRPFLDAKECSDEFRKAYNHKFGTNYTIKELKAKINIYDDLKDYLSEAIQRADNLSFEPYDNPYTNMHEVIKSILK